MHELPRQAPVVGIWTPCADVLCVPCHVGKAGAKSLPLSLLTRADKPVEKILQDQAITACDGCGRPIVLQGDVAREHNLVLALKAQGIRAAMAQTGGMHSAARVPLPGGGHLLVSESDADAETDQYLIWEYGVHGECQQRQGRKVVGFHVLLDEVGRISQVK